MSRPTFLNVPKPLVKVKRSRLCRLCMPSRLSNPVLHFSFSLFSPVFWWHVLYLSGSSSAAFEACKYKVSYLV